MNPVFSVITATYNSGTLLLRTAESLSRQTFNNFEWIIIDGASTDDSIKALRSVLQPPFDLVSEPDQGISDAWNKGIRRARAEYILLLNAGDTYDPAFLEILRREVCPRWITASATRVLDEDSSFVRIFRAEPAKLNRAMHLPHNWCAVPAEMYRRFGLYSNRRLAMDFEWFHRYFKIHGSGGFKVIDQSLGEYHLGGTSDENFVASFRENERILVENGTNRATARIWRLAYTAKHASKKFLMRGKS